MKALLFLIAFACIILMFLYFCKKLGVDVGALLNCQSNQTPVQPVMYPGMNPLYEDCRVHYEHFGTIIFSCLENVAKKCFLGVPKDFTKIFCAEINDRIKMRNGQYVFNYEIPWGMSSYQDVLKGTMQKVSVKDIEDIFSRNLGTYTRGAFTFANIKVWDLGSQIRIEVYGVNLTPIYPSGGIL